MEYNQTPIISVTFRALSGLNPCSNGIQSNRQMPGIGLLQIVLILVLMEYNQTATEVEADGKLFSS